MNPSQQEWLCRHSAHDYDLLMARWMVVAERAGLESIFLAEQSGYDVIALCTGDQMEGGEGAVYLSAGVHGDEAAPVWALLEWAEGNLGFLAERKLLILPCVNPWGLVNNVRSDEAGRDLNRLFENEKMEFFQAWRKLLGERRFLVSLNLHEDYDAQGVYVYELGEGERRLADQVFGLMQCDVPRDWRETVDGQCAVGGIIHRSEDDVRRVVEEDLLGGYPEAIYLFLHHTGLALTFETPSEFAFHQRVRAQRAFIEGVVFAVGRGDDFVIRAPQ